MYTLSGPPLHLCQSCRAVIRFHRVISSAPTTIGNQCRPHLSSIKNSNCDNECTCDRSSPVLHTVDRNSHRSVSIQFCSLPLNAPHPLLIYNVEHRALVCRLLRTSSPPRRPAIAHPRLTSRSMVGGIFSATPQPGARLGIRYHLRTTDTAQALAAENAN